MDIYFGMNYELAQTCYFIKKEPEKGYVDHYISYTVLAICFAFFPHTSRYLHPSIQTIYLVKYINTMNLLDLFSVGIQLRCCGDHIAGGAARGGSDPYHAEGLLQPPATDPGGPCCRGAVRGCTIAPIASCMSSQFVKY